jgi:drug/metabolite transporter (DMT)-like permease
VIPLAWFGFVMSVVLNVAGLIAINYVFANLKAYVAGNLLLLEGVFALIVGFVGYKEVPAISSFFGAAIIMACAYAVSAIDSRGDRLEAAQAAIEQGAS